MVEKLDRPLQIRKAGGSIHDKNNLKLWHPLIPRLTLSISW